ncbi:pirin-like [Ylistrum balloti]|uniref:pirin-like n=1 Tax=Ylistrum balloti TaxID=509963 RepID=UPI002905E7B3|nr:pirin-like [Ylistrum balloti]
MSVKTVKQDVYAEEQKEDIGAVVRRSIGMPGVDYLDPFLMLDEFYITPPAGFPDHPHRGFETVSYVLQGAGMHEDCCGHKGTLHAGDVQWMTAGRGIVHCEMPSGTEEVHGLQLWVNLASKDKMIDPAYQELQDKDIPRNTKDNTTVKVIAGESQGVKSPMLTRTQTVYLDFKMQKDGKLVQPIKKGWNSFVYVLSGKALFGPEGNQTEGCPHHALILNDEGENLVAVNKGPEECHFVLIGGQPLGEPVATHGPFVMNTEEEIQQAILDYKLKQKGFEVAKTWKSDYLTNR